MAQSILIVGAGIIGAATALELAQAGHRVRVIRAGQADATSAAFGWINASFYLDADHHRLRAAGLQAWRALTDLLPIPVAWQGCLYWDISADAVAQAYDDLRSFDYPVEMLTHQQIKTLEPALKDAPQQALLLPTEGAVHAPDIAGHLLRAAQDLGVQVLGNVRVTGIQMKGDRAVGVQTDEGMIPADQVILAAGTGTTALADTVGVDIPLVSRPAYILRTRPQPPLLRHILATPEGEIRQEPSGQFLMPVAVGHQGDTSAALSQTPVAAADGATARLRTLCDGFEDLQWSEVIRAERPVPADNQPVVGHIGDGLYAAVLHSGITLGPLIAGLIAKEVTNGPDNATTAMLAPYRPQRFGE